MPKGAWTPPEAGDVPAEVKKILKEAYAAYRDKHPAENETTKMHGAKIAWFAVKQAGWHKNAEGKWVKKKKEMAEEIVIDAFKEGDYPQGKFGAKELSEIESTYDPQVYEAPILIGHLSDPSYKGKSAIPAFGWIGKVKVIADHLKLVASQFSEELKEFIKKGFYKKVSAAFFEPQDPNNPTPGKWHLHHLAFLGGAPPAVKGLEQIAFAEMLGVGVEFAEMDTEVTEDGELIDQAEELGTEDTIKDLTEACASFISKVEDALDSDIDWETCKSRVQLAASDLSGEIYHCIGMYFTFIEKLGNIEEHQGAEMSEKKNWLIQFVQSITHKRKESEMDAQKEQEYKSKITELEGAIGTLTAKVTQFEEAKRQADETAILATANVAKETKKAEVKAFCETAMTEGRMTKAEREADEPRMFTLIDNPEALKSFQEGKYPKDRKAVPLGETDLGGELPKPKGKLDLAADYVKAHATDKEFAGLNTQEAVARAVYLEATAKIKF